MPERKQEGPAAESKPAVTSKPAATRRTRAIDNPLFEPTAQSAPGEQAPARDPAPATAKPAAPKPDESRPASVKSKTLAPTAVRAKPDKAQRPAATRGGQATPAGIAAPKAKAKKATQRHPAPDEGGGSAPLDAETIAQDAARDVRRIRQLERRNLELLVQIRELENDRLTGRDEHSGLATDSEEIIEGSQGILYIVKDLEAQLDNAFALKEAVETDLADAQAKLATETDTRTQLEGRVRLLEAKGALAEQLQDELAFVEEERTETARKLGLSQAQLDETTEARDALAKQMAEAEARIDELEQAKVNLEGQVLNLQETVDDLGNVRDELAQATVAREELVQQVKDLTGRLSASETSRKALELDLATSQEVASGVNEELGDHREKLEASQASFVNVRDRLEEQQFENRELIKANRRLEREVSTLKGKLEVAVGELEGTKRALHEIHSAAARTTERIHKRYYEASESSED